MVPYLQALFPRYRLATFTLVGTLSGAGQLPSACSGRLTPISWSNASGAAPVLAVGNWSPVCFSSGHRLGSVDEWLCQTSAKPLGIPLPNIRSSWAWWGNCGSSPPKGRMGRSFSAATLVMYRLGPYLGELSGGNWIGCLQRRCLVYLRGGQLEPLRAATCFVHSAPFGGLCPRALCTWV